MNYSNFSSTRRFQENTKETSKRGENPQNSQHSTKIKIQQLWTGSSPKAPNSLGPKLKNKPRQEIVPRNVLARGRRLFVIGVFEARAVALCSVLMCINEPNRELPFKYDPREESAARGASLASHWLAPPHPLSLPRGRLATPTPPDTSPLPSRRRAESSPREFTPIGSPRCD